MLKRLAFVIAVAVCFSHGKTVIAAPAPSRVTPELVAAAETEGKLVFYSALDLYVAELVAKKFEEKYPKIKVQAQRSGSERIYLRVEQEYASGIHAVDVVDSTDLTHFLAWKRKGILVPYVPEDVVAWPKEQRDPDGFFATNRATLSAVGYNTQLFKDEDAPKSYLDLLEPRFKGKIVKAHPGYSGNIMTSTFILSRLLGWSYFEKLGQQRVLQIQSSTEPPKKLALGERSVMFDGNEYNTILEIKKGAPLKLVYMAEGTPLMVGTAAVVKDAPHPNAARLFLSFLYSLDVQQLLVNEAGTRSFHPGVKEPDGRVPLSSIKLLTSDPIELEKAIEEIKTRYAQYFGT